MMQAGEGPNTIPANASLTFDFRTLPDQTGEEAWEEVAGVVRACAGSHPAGAEIVINPPFIDSVSMEVPHDARIIGALSAALERNGVNPTLVVAPFGSDATKFTRKGTPTVVFGPGRIEEAHSNNEHVDLEEVARAANVLVTLATSL